MNTKHIITTLVLAGLLAVVPVYAEDAVLTNAAPTNAAGQILPPPPTPLPPVRNPELHPVLQARQELKDARQQDLAKLRDTQKENRDEVGEMRDNLKTLPPEDRGAAREDIREKIKENHQEMSDARDAVKKDLKEKRQDIKDAVFQKFTVRLNALVDRLTKIGDRIQTRIDELKTAGTDVTTLQASLDAARGLIAQIQTKAATIVSTTGADQTTKDANKAALDEIKGLTEQVKTAFMKMTYDLKPAKGN